MLVISRKKGENILIGEDIEISIISIEGESEKRPFCEKKGGKKWKNSNKIKVGIKWKFVLAFLLIINFRILNLN